MLLVEYGKVSDGKALQFRMRCHNAENTAWKMNQFETGATLNAPLPIVSTLSGKVSDVRLPRPWNAALIW